MSIQIHGQPIKDIPIGKQYELVPNQTPSGVKTLEEIEDRVNEFAARLIEQHCKTRGEDKRCVKVAPFKIKKREQRGNGINFLGEASQAAQLRDMENWMASSSQVLNWLQE